MNIKSIFFFCLLLLIIAGCGNDKGNSGTTEPAPQTPVISFRVLKYLHHDTSLFTEGLVMHNGQLFESTGSPDELPSARSMIGITDLQTGKFDKKIELDRTKYFGEGIVFLNGKLYQLTYKNKTGFIYDATSFKQIGSFTYSNTEGWGMTTNGKELIMSDGSSELTFIDPATLQPTKKLSVTENGVSLNKLNELEYIRGFIYANVWLTNYIVKIDANDGKVVGKLDLNILAFEARNKNPNVEVLNGIAFDSTTNNVYVTGKLWANIYEIKLPD
jgi:glutamine cyclotransferase